MGNKGEGYRSNEVEGNKWERVSRVAIAHRDRNMYST